MWLVILVGLDVVWLKVGRVGLGWGGFCGPMEMGIELE